MILMLLACVQAGSKPGAVEIEPPVATDSESVEPEGEIVSIAIDQGLGVGVLTVDGWAQYDINDPLAEWSGGWRSISGGNGEVCLQCERGYSCFDYDAGSSLEMGPPLFPLSAVDWKRTTCEGTAPETAHCCSLTSLGGLYCWGEEGDEWIGRSGVTDYSVCGEDVLYIQDGTVHRWGSFGALDPSIAGEATAVGGHGEHACVLRPDGQIDCNDPSNSFMDPPPDGTFVSISIDDLSNCAVSTAGDIQCWGYDDPLGQTFYYGAYNQAGAYTQVVVSDQLGCAITLDACVVCWSGRFEDWEGGSGYYPNVYEPLCHAGQVLTE